MKSRMAHFNQKQMIEITKKIKKTEDILYSMITALTDIF